jgi:YD repeat-containing protein
MATKLPRTIALLVAATALLVAASGPATAAGQAGPATASAATNFCKRQLGRAHNSSAAAQKRQQAGLRRCVARYRRSSYPRSRQEPDAAAPAVAWKAPAGSSTVHGYLGGSACEATASDNRGVSRVVFKVDGTTLNTELYAPYNCEIDSTALANGSHTLTATAYDSAGNSSSVAATVNVSNATTPAPAPSPSPTPTGDTTPPTVAWQVPGAASTIKGTLQGSACEVTASDDRGVDHVVFKVDGTTLNTESDTPYNCIFDTTKVSDGSHTVTATAYDAAGNSSSATRTFTVSNAVAPLPEPTPEPTPAPAPSPTGMIVGLDGGNYGTSGAADVSGAVNTVRYDTERGATGLENFKKAGLRIQMLFPGPYNSGGVCALNATAWATETLAFYKANTNPTQTPVIEALNEPGGTWFWGPNAEGSANAVCYRELLKKTHNAFHAQYGESAPKILGTLDGANGLNFGKAWLTADWATYVDGFVVHPYGGTGNRTSSALGNRALVESAHAMTGGPIYITEVGWPTATGQPATGDSLQWTESEQAANITNFIAWAHDTGYVAEVVYFNYRDYGTNAWYGITRSNGSHKPAYEALRQAAAKYGV